MGLWDDITLDGQRCHKSRATLGTVVLGIFLYISGAYFWFSFKVWVYVFLMLWCLLWILSRMREGLNHYGYRFCFQTKDDARCFPSTTPLKSRKKKRRSSSSSKDIYPNTIIDAQYRDITYKRGK